MRKSLFVTVTILVVVAMCFTIPVYAGVSITEYPDVSISFDAVKKDNGVAKKVDMYSKKKIYFNQESGIGLEGNFEAKKQVVILVDNSIGTKTTTVTKINPFDYCLFSGSEDTPFNLQGRMFDIKGKIHTNHGVSIDASSFNAENEGSSKNTVEYVTTKRSSGGVSDDVFAKSQVVPMPDLEQKLTDSQITKFATYNINETSWRNDFVNPSNGQMKNQTNTYINYKDENGYKYFDITGGDQFVIPDKTTYYIKGNLKISTARGIKFVGSGMLIVTGDIISNGSGIETSTEQGKEAFLYSCEGDIDIQPGNTTLKGSFYAPKGTINIKGQTVSVVGSIIAKYMGSMPDTLNVTYYAGEVKEIIEEILPSDKVFVSTQQAAKDLLSKIPKPADVAVLQFNSTANNNDFNFYDVEKDDAKILDILNGIPASQTKERNLGDALRRAYFMLKNNKIPGNKYIVTFTAGVPNTWTVDGTSLKEDDGDAENVKVSDVGTDKSLEYVETMSDIIEKDKITQYFVNCDETKPENESNIKVVLEKVLKVPASNPKINERYFNLANAGDIDGTLETKIIDLEIKDGELLPVKVSFSFTLPAGVKLIQTSLPSWVKVDPKNPQIISGSYDTNFVWNSKAKKFIAPVSDKLNTLSLDIKYVIPPKAKLGKNKKYENVVNFVSNKVTYEVGYMPKYPTWVPTSSKVKLTTNEPVQFNPLTTNVIYKLDIN